MAAGGAAILIVAMSVYWATSTGFCDDHRNIAGNVSVSRAAFVGRYCDGAKITNFAEIRRGLLFWLVLLWVVVLIPVDSA